LPRRIGALEIDSGRLSTAGQPCSRIDGVRRLYGTLRDRYSLVIVDCPAVFTGQQTLMIAAAADETVLVLEAERTALADVGRARAALERRGAGVLGMVLNKSRDRVPSMFGGRA
jgi:Mrp family chromosome partitioning ATPase